jgi:hypothetical protein
MGDSRFQIAEKLLVLVEQGVSQSVDDPLTVLLGDPKDPEGCQPLLSLTERCPTTPKPERVFAFFFQLDGTTKSVCVRHVDPSTLVFSLSSHRH